MRGLLILLALSIIAGCGPVQQAYWVGNRTQAELQRDIYECKREAAMVPRLPYPAAPERVKDQPGGAWAGLAQGFEQGQRNAAYAAGVAAAEGAEQRAQEIETLCMQSRGNRLEWR